MQPGTQKHISLTMIDSVGGYVDHANMDSAGKSVRQLQTGRITNLQKSVLRIEFSHSLNRTNIT